MHPEAHLVGIDSSPEMLAAAAQALPRDRVTLLERDLGEALPDQAFDLVVSALAIHHVEGVGKAKLFQGIARRLAPGGHFVMGDVVIPEDPADALIENEPGYDFPSKIEDQLTWLTEAGLSAEAVWVRKDLAVLRADLTKR
jgi:tRNA (cmo5U34)-methyltransferase